MPTTPDAQRLTFHLSGEVLQAIRQLAERRGLTPAEVIRRAIGTELFFSEAQARGERILLEDRDRRLREVTLR